MKAVIAFFLFTGFCSLTLRAQSLSASIDLGHGINLGQYYERWPMREPTEKDFTTISQAGFKTIRVPIMWQAKLLPGTTTVDPAFFARIDWVVAQAHKNNLNIILDYHNDYELMKFPDKNEARFLATWKQIAEHYQAEPPTVLFEMLNEPSHGFDAPRWNAMIVKALKVIRASNPHREVVIGAIGWNSIQNLPKLVLPEDDRDILVTFHYYDPLKFTHQGASWIAVPGANTWLGTKWLGTDAELKAINTSFDKAVAWGREHNRPLFLGEFGSYQKADFDSRVRWMTAVARAADARGIPYTYWEYSDHFGAYDPVAQQWREPMLKALVPEAK